MRRLLLICGLLASLAACGDDDDAPFPDAATVSTDADDDAAALQCGPRPGGCDDVPDGFENDPACGTTVCGAWERCSCEAGEWKTEYVDCFGCTDGG